MQSPTPWQSKTMWTALTALSITLIFVLAIGAIYLTGRVLGFLQPLLIPVAIAGILAYLLDPLVTRITRLGVSRINAVLVVFGIFVVSSGLILLWIIPVISEQAGGFGEKFPLLVDTARTWAVDLGERVQERYSESGWVNKAVVSLEQQAPVLVAKAGALLQRSVGGFLGIFGLLIGLIIVPIYLFYFLKDTATISEHWTDYLPLRASHFKDEVVEVLTEINTYLIAFFRGQLLVSILDGLLIATALLIVGLDFALLIGLLIAVLALIPYLGIILCWIPAVLIAGMQYGDWVHPLIVTAIFIIMQQFEGWFIAPKIVGDSVGLHPMTVIISVFAWSLLIGGLLGAILAVPLTATLKVLLQRYVWHRRHQAATASAMV